MQVEEKFCKYSLDSNKKNDESNDGKISPKLSQAINDIIKKENFITYSLDVKILPSDGGNYLATLVEVDVRGKTKKGEKEINIFVKNIINDEHFTMFSLPDAYYKEMFAYTELFKIFTKLQDDAHVPVNERYKTVKSYDESNTECIILENIAKKGFKTLNRLETIPLSFAELSIQQLAKFHALSFVLRNRNPEYFNEKLKCLKPGFIFNDEWKSFVKNFSNITTESIDHKFKNKIEDLVPKIIEKFPKYLMDESSVMCLCHGDYRANNIMMRMEDGVIFEVIPVDFQLINYGSPINDFLYFIFGATDQQFRKDHLEDLKVMYHETMAKFLKFFDIDVESCFPKKTFDALFKERFDYGLMNAIWFLPIVLASNDDIPDFSKDALTEINFKTDKCFKVRMEEIIDDFVRWGYL